MKFVMSYSCGKDSTFALQKMLQRGDEPVGLLVMINEEAQRSWFHGADYALLWRISDALGIPLIACPARGEAYHTSFEEGLKQAKERGAQAACFGDIDIEQNRQWGVERCKAAGLSWEYPLWRRDRREIVREMLAQGVRCVIKSVNNRMLPRTLLGSMLDETAIGIMERCGVDICGENGEYHTLAVDGPAFRSKLEYELGRILDFGDISVIDIR